MDAMESKLNELLVQTQAFHNAAVGHAKGLRPIDDLRHLVAFQAGGLALEHALAARSLIADGHLPSAFALFRPQFESLVRGIWLLHAASGTWIEKFGQPLTIASAKHANEGPRFADMLKELESHPMAPSHIVVQLREFKEETWKPLNSYTHGGIHPLTRLMSGYPPQLTYDALRNSNAVLALTLQLLSILTGDIRNMEPVRHMHVEFVDCFNLLPPHASSGASI
jgi:hypothetical protein